ncbi:MAG: magnesium and cobalt transport protein CorA [Rhodospirillaceae bacterium]
MSQLTAADILKKHKIVETMLIKQHSKHQGLVEAVVKNQHIAELKSFIDRVSADEIVKILDLLAPENAALLWSYVEGIPEKDNDVLLGMPAALRERLGITREPEILVGQISLYEIVEGKIRTTVVRTHSDIANAKPIWIDLLEASAAERDFVGRHFDVELPDPDELTDLEISARFYEEDKDEIHLSSSFLLNRGIRSTSVPVAFVVHAEVLFTVRNEDLPVFRLQRLRARYQPNLITDCKDVLLDLYDADVEYSADALEDIYGKLRQIGQEVMRDTIHDDSASRILSDISEGEELNGLIRGNLLDTQRAVSFLLRRRFLSQTQSEEASQILRDIESLNTHTSFLFDKINFLMDATVGFINVNQNKRISLLTVINIVFMPLNLIAGAGGMSEYSMMTKELGLEWPQAYGLLTAAMLVIGVATYYLLISFENKRKKKAPPGPKAPHQPMIGLRRRHGGAA